MKAQEERKTLIKKYKKEIPVNNIYKTNPLAALVNGPIIYTSEYRLAIENTTFNKQSIQTGISYIGKGSILRYLEKNDSTYIKNKVHKIVSGFRIQFSYRYYLSKKTLSGFYVASNYSFSSVKFIDQGSNYGDYIHAIYSNFAEMGGYQFLINRKLAIDLFFGYGYKENTWYEVRNLNYKETDEDNSYIIPEPVKIYLGFNIGLAF